jgi:hypothetical protein
VAGRYAEAIVTLKRVLIRNPDLMPAHVYLGTIYTELGQGAVQAKGEEVLRLSPQLSPAALRQRLPYQDQTVRERVLNAAHKQCWGELTPRTPHGFPASSPKARTLNGRPRVNGRQDQVLERGHQSEGELANKRRGPIGREFLVGECFQPKATCVFLEGVRHIPRGFRRTIHTIRCSKVWGAVMLSATSILRRCVATGRCLRSPCPSPPLCYAQDERITASDSPPA